MFSRVFVRRSRVNNMSTASKRKWGVALFVRTETTYDLDYEPPHTVLDATPVINQVRAPTLVILWVPTLVIS